MKLNIEATLNGNEIIGTFLEQLKNNNLDVSASDIKILVLSKEKEVEITPDRIRLVYQQTKV